MTKTLTRDQTGALREFARGQLAIGQLLSRLDGLVEMTGEVGNREVVTKAMPEALVEVRRDDIRWVLERYVRGKLSGEDLSNWAGLLLALPVYALPFDYSEDEPLLELLTDLAMPLKPDYFDRDRVNLRIKEIWQEDPLVPKD